MKINYERTYIKIQDVLAEINGVLALGFLVVSILCMSHLENNMYESVVNDLFDISLNYDQGKKNNNSSLTPLTYSNPRNLLGIIKNHQANNSNSQGGNEQT